MANSTDAEPRPPVSVRSLTAIVDVAAASHAHAVGILLIVGLMSFLPGFFAIPPIDRDEARFAQATKQMVETGDYIDIRFQDEVRYKKPVGIYWLQAAVVRAAEAPFVRPPLLPDQAPRLTVLVEVNVGGEAQKSGCEPREPRQGRPRDAGGARCSP